VKDVAASHGAVIHMFERIHLFLQRLNIYTGIPLMDELTELLGKIMAQLLCILALSTKVMADGRMGEMLAFLYPFLVDYGTENIRKKLMGRKDVEDALQKLDMLTNEETSMTLARNLKATHDIDNNVTEIKVLTEGISSDVNVTKHGTHHLMPIFPLPYLPTQFSVVSQNSNGRA